jgi:hypothetical protein|uniref:Uncharacterized protein n=1 Tax=Podoviridae sp. ctoqT5 TaxID=2826577 RepID=A0A8S5MPZ1_9CAUD|nr:MAG TPA: hypothetical protein [Podoviridae sp. ctoqT5]DAK01890.1 MAG TPA: hypothetical protein [Caudoviricetes sp.]
MLKANITTATTVAANTDIPLNLVFNTNCRTGMNGNRIKINSCGAYDIEALFNITGVAAGDISLQMFNNGVAIPDAVVGATSAATTNQISLNLTDIIRALRNNIGTDIALSFRLSAAATINNAIVTVEKIQ